MSGKAGSAHKRTGYRVSLETLDRERRAQAKRDTAGKSRSLALLQPGPGERRDCRRWSACIGDFMRACPGVSACHCPEGCASFAPVSNPDATWTHSNVLGEQ